MEKASYLNLAAIRAMAATGEPGTALAVLAPSGMLLLKGGCDGNNAGLSGDKRKRRTGG